MVESTRFSIHWRTRNCEKMMADTMTRFRGCNIVAAENIWELREELLDLRWSREERFTAESRLRRRRGVEYHRLQTLSHKLLP